MDIIPQDTQGVNYYTYLYIDPETDIPFYVGMGKGRRRFDHLKLAISSPEPVQGEHKLNTIRKILRTGSQPIIKIVVDNLTRDQAILFEEILIEHIGRTDLGAGPLTNQTKGGDGLRGWSYEQKQKVRERNIKLGIKPPSQKGRKQNRHPEYTNIPARIVATGQIIKVKPNDLRWASGEIIGINKGIIQDAEWRRKNSEGVSRLRWWHNDQNCVRSIEKPSPDYVPGRGSFYKKKT